MPGLIPEVSHVEVVRAFDSNVKKLEIKVVGDDSKEILEMIVEDLLSFRRTKELIGRAPAGDLEQLLQRWLDSLNHTD